MPAMANQLALSDDLIQRLTHRPLGISEGMIRVPEPIVAPAPRNQCRSSSLGLLDRMPSEILRMILSELDIRSLSRVSCVSIRGQDSVLSLRSFHDLLKYCPQALAAMGRTGLASRHKVSRLYEALRSDSCVSCYQYGAFLFLPTCERCCYECLLQNPLLWVTTIGFACRAFKLTRDQLKDLPTMHSIPGSYFVGRRHSCNKRLRLISVKVAKERAISIHGSSDPFTRLSSSGIPLSQNRKAAHEFYELKHIREVSLQAPGQEMSHIPRTCNVPNDEYSGMASIEFPTLLPDQSVETGHWYLGCEGNFQKCRLGEFSQSTVSTMVPARVNPHCTFLARARRARSIEELSRHVIHCPGSLELCPELRTRMCED